MDSDDGDSSIRLTNSQVSDTQHDRDNIYHVVCMHAWVIEVVMVRAAMMLVIQVEARRSCPRLTQVK